MSTQVYIKPAQRSDWSLTLPPATPDGIRQVHMWNILRGPQGRERPTAAELALFSSTDSLPVGEAQARRYLEALAGRNAARSFDGDRWELRNSLRKHAEPALLLRATFLYVPSWSLPDGRTEAEEAPL